MVQYAGAVAPYAATITQVHVADGKTRASGCGNSNRKALARSILTATFQNLLIASKSLEKHKENRLLGRPSGVVLGPSMRYMIPVSHLTGFPFG